MKKLKVFETDVEELISPEVVKYIGIILRGTDVELEELKKYVVNHTSLEIKFITRSRRYLLIQKAKPTKYTFGKDEEVGDL